MSPGQMLPGQMLLRQLKSVQHSPMNLRLKFSQNRVSNSWDIADIEFVWGGVEFTVIFMSNLQLQLRLFCSWVWVLTKILAQKRCQYNKMFDQKKIMFIKSFVPQKFWLQKKFWSKNILPIKMLPIKKLPQKILSKKVLPKKGGLKSVAQKVSSTLSQ